MVDGVNGPNGHPARPYAVVMGHRSELVLATTHNPRMEATLVTANQMNLRVVLASRVQVNMLSYKYVFIFCF